MESYKNDESEGTMTIDWETFLQRVPMGIKVSSVRGEVFEILENWREVPYFGGGRCGILLSFEISKMIDIPDYFTDERGEPFECCPAAIIVQPFDFVDRIEFYDPSDLEYEINKQWVTFEEIMR